MSSQIPSTGRPSDPRRPPGASPFHGVARHSVIYGLGIVFARAVSFLMLPIYTRYLTPADYGVMALVEMTLDFVSIIGGAQLALGVFRFYHKTSDESTRQQIVSTSFLLVGGMYAVVGIFTFFLAESFSVLLFGSTLHSNVIRVAAANLAVGSLLIVPLAFARVTDHSVLFVTANAVKLVAAVALNLLFVVALEMGVVGVFLSTLTANALVGGGLAVWLVRRVGLRWSRNWTRDLIRYGVPLMGMQVATFLATFSDRYFLLASSSESVVGLYNLGYQFGFILVVVGFTPFDMVWGPRRFEVARGPDGQDAIARGFVLMNVLLLTTAVAISLFVADVLRVMATPQFHAAAQVVPLILVAYVLQCWASIQDLGILLEEKTKYLTLANFLSAGVAVAGYALLIPRYLQWGAAIATVIAFATRYVLTYVYSQRLHRFEYRWRPVCVLSGWSVVIAGAGLALPSMGIVPSVATRAFLGLLYLGGVWRLPILEGRDRESARRLMGAAVTRLRPKPS